jgi:hypothetical protein
MLIISKAYTWIGHHVGFLPALWRPVIVLPTLIVAAFLVVSLVVRRLLPGLAELFAVPLLTMCLLSIGIAALILQTALCLPARCLRRSPPRFLYIIGDVSTAAIRAAPSQTRKLSRPFHRLRKTPQWLIAASVLALFVWWNHSYCPRMGACDSPLREWVDQFR